MVKTGNCDVVRPPKLIVDITRDNDGVAKCRDDVTMDIIRD